MVVPGSMCVLSEEEHIGEIEHVADSSAMVQ